MTGVFSVDSHVDDRADAVAVDCVDTQLLHELVVACGDRYTVDLRENAPAADLFNVRDAAAVDLFSVRLLQALADGMGRGALGERCVLEKLLLLHRAVVDGADLKDALRQCAGLIEDDGLDLRECLQVIRALDENAFLARPADACEEAQGNAYHKRARAACDEERQGSVHPLLPLRRKAHHKPDDRRKNCERQRAVTDGGGVDSCKFRDEVLGAGLAGARVFNQLENFGDGRLAEFLRCADFQNARHVDATADDLVAGLCVARQALTGQRACVERGRTVDDYAVERHLFARLYDDDGADRDLIRVDLFELAVHLNVRVVWADIHKGGNVLAALADGVALEEFSDLVEQHDGDGFVIIAALFVDRQCECTDGGDGHQEVFIEHPAV